MREWPRTSAILALLCGGCFHASPAHTFSGSYPSDGVVGHSLSWAAIQDSAGLVTNYNAVTMPEIKW